MTREQVKGENEEQTFGKYCITGRQRRRQEDGEGII